MQTYRHFNIVPTANGGMAVHDPRWPAKPIHVATDVDHARQWIRAHRDGRAWAAQTAIPA